MTFEKKMQSELAITNLVITKKPLNNGIFMLTNILFHKRTRLVITKKLTNYSVIASSDCEYFIEVIL